MINRGINTIHCHTQRNKLQQCKALTNLYKIKNLAKGCHFTKHTVHSALFLVAFFPAREKQHAMYKTTLNITILQKSKT